MSAPFFSSLFMCKAISGGLSQSMCVCMDACECIVYREPTSFWTRTPPHPPPISRWSLKVHIICKGFTVQIKYGSSQTYDLLQIHSLFLAEKPTKTQCFVCCCIEEVLWENPNDFGVVDIWMPVLIALTASTTGSEGKDDWVAGCWLLLKGPFASVATVTGFEIAM